MNKPLSVLLVDDDEDEYTIVRDLLRDVGANASVTWVPSYEKGLAKVCERTWDVCLVDYYLGARTGLHFVEATASLGCHSPMILLTGQADRATDDDAMRRGAADYLQKSGLTGEALEQSVRHAIERNRALKTSQNFLQSTLDALTAHICILDPDGQILAVNQAWSRFALENGGDPHRCALGANYLQVCDRAVDCEEATQVARDVRALVAGDQDDCSLVYASSRRWFLMRISRFSDGEPRCLVVSHEDITSHRQAELSLQRSDERFRLAFESVPVGLIVLTRDQHIWKSNHAFRSMLGYSEEQLLRRPLADLLHDDDRERVSTGGQSLRLVGLDGEVSWVNYTSVQVQEDDDSYELGIVENKTRELQRDEQIHHLRQMEEVARLAGGVAHDFNNVLTAIQGNAALILTDLPQDHGVRVLVDEIAKASLRASGLTQQLLAFSHKQILQPRTLHLNQVLEGMLETLRKLIGDQIHLTTHLADTLWWVWLDPAQLEQVVTNLVVNAGQAMPGGGTVCLRSSNLEVDAAQALERMELNPGRYVQVEVEDSGPGMRADVLRHVFEPFFTTRRHATGLGLSIVHGVLKQSGGMVWVDTHLGRGSTFHLLFPAVLAPGPEDGPVVAEAPQPVAEGLGTVLVVDDQDMVRALAIRILRRAGYTVLEARCGEEALQMCVERRADQPPISLLVTDVVMPGLSGPQLVDKLHGLFPRALVLYTSGYTDDTVLIARIKAQRVAFLPKPFSPDQLLQSVQAALEGRLL